MHLKQDVFLQKKNRTIITKPCFTKRISDFQTKIES